MKDVIKKNPKHNKKENRIVVINNSFLLTGKEKQTSTLLLRCTKENKRTGKAKEAVALNTVAIVKITSNKSLEVIALPPSRKGV